MTIHECAHCAHPFKRGHHTREQAKTSHQTHLAMATLRLTDQKLVPDATHFQQFKLWSVAPCESGHACLAVTVFACIPWIFPCIACSLHLALCDMTDVFHGIFAWRTRGISWEFAFNECTVPSAPQLKENLFVIHTCKL